MNHGRCVGCWWYKAITEKYVYVSIANLGISEKLGKGKCYMHNGGNDAECDYKLVNGESYCPDYLNRKRGDREMGMSLDEWISTK